MGFSSLEAERRGTDFLISHPPPLPLGLANSLPQSLPPAKGYRFPWVQKCRQDGSQVPCPVEWREVLAQKSHTESWHVSGGTCACQSLPLLHLQWFDISGLARRRKWLFHSAVHLLLSSGWAAKRWGRGQIWGLQSNVASGTLYNSEIISTSSKQFFLEGMEGSQAHEPSDEIMSPT